MSWASLMNWWNYIFALPLVVGLVLGVLFVLTGLIDTGDLSHDGHGDAHDVGGHADAHDAGAHADPHEGGAHDAHHADSHHDASDHGHHFSFMSILHLFGIGTGVPITVLIPTLMMTWGIVGLGSNQLLQPLLKLPALYAPISALFATGGMMLMGQVAGILARRLGLFDTTPAPARRDLVGCSGYAVFPITETEGTANIKSRTGDILRVSCRVAPGQPTIPAGTELLVIEYNEEWGGYIVEPHPFSPALSEPKQQENEQTEQTQIWGR